MEPNEEVEKLKAEALKLEARAKLHPVTQILIVFFEFMLGVFALLCVLILTMAITGAATYQFNPELINRILAHFGI